MKIEINLLAAYKLLAGKGKITLQLEENTSVQTVVLQLIKRHPGLKRAWLDASGTPQPYLHIFLNGDDISTLADGLETKLVENDVLEFIPPLSGG